jgi:hypothetical protein
MVRICGVVCCLGFALVPVSGCSKGDTSKGGSVDAPKEVGVTAKVNDGKVTVSAAKDAKVGTHEVKVKGAKGDATIKVKVKKE